MKRLICIAALLLVSLLLSACGGKLSEGMQVEITEGDTYYSNEDIQAAVDTVEKEFKKDFPGCTMTALRYTALSGKDSNTEWATQYNAEEAMVLYSDFTVDRLAVGIGASCRGKVEVSHLGPGMRRLESLNDHGRRPSEQRSSSGGLLFKNFLKKFRKRCHKSPCSNVI